MSNNNPEQIFTVGGKSFDEFQQMIAGIRLPVKPSEETEVPALPIAEDIQTVSAQSVQAEEKARQPVVITAENFEKIAELDPGTPVTINDEHISQQYQEIFQKYEQERMDRERQAAEAKQAEQEKQAEVRREREARAREQAHRELGLDDAPRTIEDHLPQPSPVIRPRRTVLEATPRTGRGKKIGAIAVASLALAGVSTAAVTNFVSSSERPARDAEQAMVAVPVNESVQENTLAEEPTAEATNEPSDKPEEVVVPKPAEPTEEPVVDARPYEELGLELDCTAILGTKAFVNSTSNITLGIKDNDGLLRPINEPIITSENGAELKRDIQIAYEGNYLFSACSPENDALAYTDSGITVDFKDIEVRALTEPGGQFAMDRWRAPEESEFWTQEAAIHINNNFIPLTENPNDPAVTDEEVVAQHIEGTFKNLDNPKEELNQLECQENIEKGIKDNIADLIEEQITEYDNTLPIPAISFAGKPEINFERSSELPPDVLEILHEIKVAEIDKCNVTLDVNLN